MWWSQENQAFLCACSLDQPQLSEEVTEILKTLEKEKPQLFIVNKK